MCSVATRTSCVQSVSRTFDNEKCIVDREGVKYFVIDIRINAAKGMITVTSA